MRLFKGDGPAAQFEAGKQKGGNYHCWGCPIHRSRVSDYVHASYFPLLSLNNRVNKVTASTPSIEASNLKKTKYIYILIYHLKILILSFTSGLFNFHLNRPKLN